MEKDPREEIGPGIDISDEDIFSAMKETEGYLDITPGDFREVYRLAHRHAVERIRSSIRARDMMTREVLSVSRETPLGVVAEKMAERAVVSSPAVTVGEEATLTEIAEIFTRRNINRVPVVDGEGRMTGIVSRADVVKASRVGKR